MGMNALACVDGMSAQAYLVASLPGYMGATGSHDLPSFCACTTRGTAGRYRALLPDSCAVQVVSPCLPAVAGELILPGQSASKDRGDRGITVLSQFFRPSGQYGLDAIRYRTHAIIDGTRCLFLKHELASVELTTDLPCIGVRWVRQKGAHREGLPNVAYSLIRR